MPDDNALLKASREGRLFSLCDSGKVFPARQGSKRAESGPTPGFVGGGGIEIGRFRAQGCAERARTDRGLVSSGEMAKLQDILVSD